MSNPPFRAVEMGPPLSWPCFEVQGLRPGHATEDSSGIISWWHSWAPKSQTPKGGRSGGGRQGAVPAEHNVGVFPYNKSCTTGDQPHRHACDQVHCLHPPRPSPPLCTEAVLQKTPRGKRLLLNVL